MPSTTLANYRTRIAAKLGLDTGDATELALIDSWLNEGYEDFLRRTRCTVRRGEMTTTGTADETLDDEILAILDIYVENNNDVYRLERVQPWEIMEMRRSNPSSDTGTRYFALSGQNMFHFYPTPSDSEVVVIFYVRRPTALSATGDTPADIPGEFHKALEYFALAEGGDYDDDRSSSFGAQYRERYELMILQCKKGAHFKGGRSLPPARVGRRRLVPHDNSTDWR